MVVATISSTAQLLCHHSKVQRVARPVSGSVPPQESGYYDGSNEFSEGVAPLNARPAVLMSMHSVSRLHDMMVVESIAKDFLGNQPVLLLGSVHM